VARFGTAKFSDKTGAGMTKVAESSDASQRLTALESARENEEIARMFRTLRTKARLTQAQLAKVVATPRS